jgi:hypothetical protein
MQRLDVLLLERHAQILRRSLPPFFALNGQRNVQSHAMESETFEFQDTLTYSLVDASLRKPSRQPSSFWKALSYTFLPFLSASPSLEDDDQALFVAAQSQAGIPEGRKLPQEVTNYQVFIKTDGVQTINRPSYSVSNGRSYFDLLYM